MVAEGGAGIEGAEPAPVLEQGDGAVDEPLQVAVGVGRHEVEAVDGAGVVPGGDEFGEVDGAAPVDGRGAGAARPGSAAAVRGDGRVLPAAEVDGEHGQDPQGAGVAARGLGAGEEFLAGGAGGGRALGVDEGDVGVAGGEVAGVRARGVGHDDRAALRRARHDRGAPDAEGAAGEVGVVELVAVDEAAGGEVTDLGVVLPAVPEPPGRLGDLGRLVPQGGGGGGGAAAEEAGLCLGGGDGGQPAGPAAADPVEGGDGGLEVERLGVGGGDGGDEADPGGGGGGDGERLEGVGPAFAEGVGEGDEVQGAVLGEPDPAGPVGGGVRPGGAGALSAAARCRVVGLWGSGMGGGAFRTTGSPGVRQGLGRPGGLISDFSTASPLRFHRFSTSA